MLVFFIEVLKRDIATTTGNAVFAKNTFTKRIMMKKKKLKPPVKISCGKQHLSNWVIDNFPEKYQELTYVEPMCAGASVFLNKDSSLEEVINDLDTGLICIYKALRDESKEFIGRIKKIRYEERVFDNALKKSEIGFEDYVDQAVNEYIVRCMSCMGLGKLFSPCNRSKKISNSWDTFLAELPLVAERIKSTVILNKNAFELMKVWDEDDTLWYLDPPELPGNNIEEGVEQIPFEMTIEEHINLLKFANNARGKVIISGFSSPLYNRTLKGWKTKKKPVPASAQDSEDKEIRTEVIWLNY